MIIKQPAIVDNIIGNWSDAREFSAEELKIIFSPSKLSSLNPSNKFLAVNIIAPKKPIIGNISQPPIPIGPVIVGATGVWLLILSRTGDVNLSNNVPQDGQNLRLSGRSELQLEHFMVYPITEFSQSYLILIFYTIGIV